MIRRQRVLSRTAREYCRVEAPESTSRTPASSTPPDEILSASFSLLMLHLLSCVRVGGFPVFWALPRTCGTDSRPNRGWVLA